MDRDLYPGAPPVQLRETHASWVFLAGERAYKVKKPVRLAFLDYGTLARRRAACEEEVRVNRELAPGVYVGVAAILARDGRLAFAPAGAHGAREYAVLMRRFDERDTLAGALRAHTLREDAIGEVAARIAAFHARAPRAPGGTAAELLRTWRTNLDELARVAHPRRWRVEAMGAFGEAFAAAHAAELRRRRARGLVRDGHGDLRCEHVLLGERVRIVDRIEFDPALRHMDVARDLAFLAMDLEARGRRASARALASAYRRAGGSPGSEALRAFYAAYWALVRAKVALIAAGERHGREAARERERARRLWRLAERLCWRARAPFAIVVCGPAASGKSTLAAALGRAARQPVISSDVIRKRRAGLAPTARARPEHYTRAFTRAVYEQLGREALAALERGGGAIVDASCHSRARRAALFALLRTRPTRLLVVRCEVPLQTALARAGARETSTQRVSDATAQIVERQFRGFQPLDELAGGELLELDAERELDEQLAAVASALDAPCAIITR
jgi:uncharacterized protein